jgi:hypothetical protein
MGGRVGSIHRNIVAATRRDFGNLLGMAVTVTAARP